MRRPSRYGFAVTAAALVAAALFGGCGGGTRAASADSGRSLAYATGEPAFDLEAVATVQGDTSGLDIIVSLPREAVVYRTDGARRFAAVRWTLAARNARSTLASFSRVDSLEEIDSRSAGPPLVRMERLALPPGTYEVEALAEDLISGRVAVRVVQVLIPALATTTVTGLRLEGQADSSGFAPLVALAIHEGLDSLRTVAQVVGIREAATIRLSVVRIPADLDAPTLPQAFTPMPGSLASRGADLSGTRDDTVSVSSQPLDNPDEVVTVIAPVPDLEPGVYRIRMTVLPRHGGDAVATTDRLIVVRRRDFPTLRHMGDLIAPLQLLASPREWSRLRDAPTPAVQREAFDRFWGEFLEDRRVAAATIRAFYERVEEANRRFSVQKEGWKTDRGMIFVLYGAPADIHSTLAEETWTYGSGATDAPVFVFKRTADPWIHGTPYPVFTLQRDGAYEPSWRRVARMWRHGEVP